MAKKSLGFNIVYQTIYQIFLTITPLITTPFVSRMLGAEGVGTYSYTLSMCKYFMLFALLGISDYGCRSIAAVRDDREKLSKTFINIFTFQALSSFIAIIVYFLYCYFFVSQDLMVAYLQGMMVISCLFDISWFFIGVEKIQVTVTRGILIKLLTMALTFTLVNKETGVIAYTLAMAGGTLISQMALWLCLKSEIDFVKPEKNEVLRHIKPNLILFAPVIAQSVFQLMDKSMLGWFSTKAQSGYYFNVDMLVNVPEGIIGGLGTVFLARLSYLYAEQNEKEINGVLLQSFELFTCVACPLVFGIAGIANEFVPLFFGQLFLPCIQLAYLLCPVIILKTYSTLLKNEVFIPSHRENYFTFSVVVAAIVNLILNSILIPKFGATGAVIGTIGAEFSELFVLAVGFRKTDTSFQSKELLTNLIYYVFALIMFLGVRGVARLIAVTVGSIILSVLLQVAAGVVIYSLLCLIYWKTSKSYIGELVKNIIKR